MTHPIHTMLILMESNFSLFWVLLIVIIIWLVLLTYLFLKAIGSYNRLTRGVTDKTLSEVLTQMLEENRVSQKQQKQIQAEIEKLEHKQLGFFGSISLVRFNPFTDTGGNTSFALALLNGEQNGIVITSLYSRAGSRWYVKTIKKGKAQEFELSHEEEEAVKKALVKNS